MNQSAQAAWLGFEYQALVGLWSIVHNKGALGIAFEKAQDVELVKSAAGIAIQTKRHGNGSISHHSIDFWKTLSNWCDQCEVDAANLDKNCILLTTQPIAKNSWIGELTKLNPDINSVYQKIQEQDDDTTRGYQRFIDNVRSKREVFLKSILRKFSIAAESDNIDELRGKIKEELRYMFRSEALEHAYTMIEGWWLSNVISILQDDCYMSSDVFHEHITYVIEQHHIENLPLTHREDEPVEGFGEDFEFYAKLLKINLSSKRLRHAVIDYYKALKERSSWSRYGLISRHELDMYDKRLLNEWDRQMAITIENCNDDKELAEIEISKLGKKLYNILMEEHHFPIKPKITEEYIHRGTYHLIADDKSKNLFWKPQIQQRIAMRDAK